MVPRVAREGTTPTLPLYVRSLLLAYDDIYDVYNSTADVFRRRHAGTVDGLFDMHHFFDDVIFGLRPTARRCSLRISPRSPRTAPPDPRPAAGERRRSMAADRPVRTYHSPDDEEVPYEDALVSVERLRRRGATPPSRRWPVSITSTAGSRRCRGRCDGFDRCTETTARSDEVSARR